MNNFRELVENYVQKPCLRCHPYGSAGAAYYVTQENFNGYYWFYECKDFVVDIHDLYIKQDFIQEVTAEISTYPLLSSSYIVSGSGEWLCPYMPIEPASILIMNFENATTSRYTLHGNTRYYAICIRFKPHMIEEFLIKKSALSQDAVARIFLETRHHITSQIAKLAKDIVNCKMTGISAELFYEAKAKEWLSVTLDAYTHRTEIASLEPTDRNAIENVANYINDHYALTISQEFLEKMASMSGTKLKTTFKRRYNMTITEYTQRKRMNVAENLLMTTDLPIRNIAKLVGYGSASRFSALFKKYKGIHPKEVRTIHDHMLPQACHGSPACSAACAEKLSHLDEPPNT